jgi:hypothetical protein
MHAQSSSASIRLTSKPCRHPRDTGDDDDESQKKRREDVGDAVESRLRFVFCTLKDMFQNVEVVYEGNKATYEIRNDSGLEAGVLDDDGLLLCTVSVEFDYDVRSNATITVECKDQKFASNVQECLRNVCTATIPIQS